MPSPKQSRATSQTAKLKLLREASRAYRHYGIPHETFWRLTPNEFRAIESDALKELQVQEERENRRAARIVAAIYNNHPNRKKSAKVLTEEDFLPKTRNRTNRSANDLLAKVAFIHNALCSAYEAKQKK